MIREQIVVRIDKEKYCIFSKHKVMVHFKELDVFAII